MIFPHGVFVVDAIERVASFAWVATSTHRFEPPDGSSNIVFDEGCFCLVEIMPSILRRGQDKSGSLLPQFHRKRQGHATFVLFYTSRWRWRRDRALGYIRPYFEHLTHLSLFPHQEVVTRKAFHLLHSLSSSYNFAAGVFPLALVISLYNKLVKNSLYSSPVTWVAKYFAASLYLLSFGAFFSSSSACS